MDRKDSQKVDGVQLIRTIANKDKDEEAAKKALDLFVSSFESKIKKRVEILAIIQIAIIISLSILLYTVRFYQIEDIIYVGVIHALLVWLPLYIKARML